MDTDNAYTDWQSGSLRVVQNLRGEYSIWPVAKDLPFGWAEVGKSGNKEECLKYIEEVWDPEEIHAPTTVDTAST